LGYPSGQSLNAKDNPALILLIAAAAVCLIAFLLFAIGGVLIYQSWSIQRGWTAADAKVMRSRVVPVKKHLGETGAQQFKTEFDVRYQVDKRFYTGTVEAPYHSDDEQQMHAWAEQYAIGAAMAVKFNPKNPARVVFGGDANYESGTFLLRLTLFVAIVGVGLLYAALRQQRGLSVWPRTSSVPAQ
jgi:hypothetical protein